MVYTGQIPFDPKTGNPLPYAQIAYLNNRDVIWRDNEPFSATMNIVDFERGRSAAHFILKDEFGRQYVMFLTDLLYLIKNFRVESGKTTRLNWVFCKRGRNYGVQVFE
jgi:hypothetical protein